MLKVLTEASGSLVTGYLIKAIKEHAECVASDSRDDCFGKYLADDFICLPPQTDANYWSVVESAIKTKGISLVIPSLDEQLIGWADRKEELEKQGIFVMLSDKDVIQIFQDKWLTYQFFKHHNIPTPKTSLTQAYSLIKPRNGRGSKGIKITNQPCSMGGMISQELLTGEEYTVDVFCNADSEPVYIVPRKRLHVKDGKSTEGIVIHHEGVINWVKKICNATNFKGPLNMQCFVDGEDISFIEINPRIAGGMALGFAATENWVKLIIDHFVHGKTISPKPIQYGMEMKRYYAEIFVPKR